MAGFNKLMENQIYTSTLDIIGVLKKDYPNLMSVVVCAFGICYNFYSDDIYTKHVAQSRFCHPDGTETEEWSNYVKLIMK